MTHHTHVPHSLLGVFLVNVLIHMHLLIGGVGIHLYCIRSKTGAGIDSSRVLPAIIMGTWKIRSSNKLIIIQNNDWQTESEFSVLTF